MSKLSTALVAFAAAAFATPAAAQSYDAYAGFNGNPVQDGPGAENGVNNGNFIYGAISSPTSGSFFSANTNCAVPGSICLQSTGLGGNASLPGVYKGGSSFGTLTVPTNGLLIHPGSNNDITVAAFVAPTAGFYRLYATFTTQDSSPTGIDLYRIGVQPNGAAPFTFDQLASNTKLGSPYTDYQLVRLNASQMIGYGIGNGGNFSDDSTGVRFSVRSGVPEPATWGLMILGFGAIGYALRRRARTIVSYA